LVAKPVSSAESVGIVVVRIMVGMKAFIISADITNITLPNLPGNS
jgi:hypothetical protein